MSFLAFVATFGALFIVAAVFANIFPLFAMIMPPYRIGPSRYVWGAVALAGPASAFKLASVFAAPAFYLLLLLWAPCIYVAYRLAAKKTRPPKVKNSVSDPQ